MKRNTIFLACLFVLFAASFVFAQDYLLISEIVVTPNDGEFIEIYNGTGAEVSLQNYYLTDAIYQNDCDYINIVDGSYTMYASDFLAQFPADAVIADGGVLVIAFDGAGFNTQYGKDADYEMKGTSDSTPDMVAPGTDYIGSSAGLSNSGEMCLLFFWDGLSDLVKDVDYLVWGDKAEYVDKSGLTKDGPDADTDASAYLNDTPQASQISLSAEAPHAIGESIARTAMVEIEETLTGGNGLLGHDETSENLGEGWVVAAPTPGAVPTGNAVTFQCNMDIQIQAGTFDPANDKLVARGSFNGWGGEADELTDDDADKVYTLTVNLADSLVGTVVEFKYVIIPAAGGDMWESVDNRTFTLEAGGQVLDVVYYNNQSVILVTAMVTFKADMAEMLDKGWFDPAVDSIRVVGGMNGWASTESMEPDPFDPSLYIKDLDVTAAEGDQIGWKFRAYPNDRFLDGGWEGGENHIVDFTGSDIVLDPMKPNIVPAGTELAQDVTVRFNVNVNGAVDWYNKEPFQDIKSVWVTGDWNNWGGAWSVADTATLIRLYDDGTNGDATPGDGIWTSDVLFAAGEMSTHYYKYSIYAAGVDTLNGGTESMDNEAGFAMNHFLLIDDTNPLYNPPLDIFGSQWREAPSTHPVTFQCNMDIQIQAGNFDPANDKLVARGSFNGWGGEADELTDDDADQVYTLTVDLADSLVGTVVEFKYVIIPAAGGDMWESVDNRTFTLEAGGQVLDVVYYNNQSVILVTAMVTFKADMAEMLDKGWFDPAEDSIRVVGGMNGWASTESMEPDPFDPSLYIKDLDVTAAEGDQIGWKFRAYPNDRFLDGGWEGGENHIVDFTGSDIVLDPMKPNIVPAGTELAQDVTVRFNVDVNNALDWYNKQPFQDIKSVWVTGDWNNWGGAWSVADTATLIRLYDDGSNGDATPFDGIWTSDVLFAAGEMSTHYYKYSIYAAGVDTLNGGTESMDNEAGFAMNHFLLIDDTNPLYTPPLDMFGSQWNTSVDRVTDAALPTDFELRQNYPNPFNPSTDIMYALPKSSSVRLTVYNSLGRKIATLVEEKQEAGTYRATWDGRNEFGQAVASGIYFYHLATADFVSTMKMLLIK